MRKLNTKQFAQCFTHWLHAVAKPTDGDVIAIDGKTLRGSYDGDKKSAIHRVSVWSCAKGVILGQEKTAEKSNELTVIPHAQNLDAVALWKNIDKDYVTTCSYIMTKQEKLMRQARNNPSGASFDDFKTLLNRCQWVERPPNRKSFHLVFT